VGAVWTTPDSGPDSRPGAKSATGSRIHSGHFFIDGNGVVAENPKAAQKNATRQSAIPRTNPLATATAKNAQQVAALSPARQKEPQP
jgi:hypothetical protein